MSKSMSKQSKIKAIIAVFLLLAILTGAVFGILAIVDSQLTIKTEIKEFKLDENLRVGVISDTQLPPTEKGSKKYEEHLYKALKVLQNRQVNMILFPGDITDIGSDYAFETFNKVVDRVYGENKPIIQMIMGNHDYWQKTLTYKRIQRDKFTNAYDQSPWTHYKVNGYHFIGASPSSGSMTDGYSQVIEWLDKELEKAALDTPDLPIFVQTHNQPLNTSYGSEDWGDKGGLNDVFKKYPNVVNLSGHVHYSLLDERSIWQKDYTVINTQSLSYTEMENGKANGSIPPNATDTPMGYIMDFSDDKIEFLRINFADGQSGIEEKADKRWQLPLPYSKEKFLYTHEQKNTTTKPTMSGTGSFTTDDDTTILKFTAGSHIDFVHSYKIVYNDGKEQLYFSDFYNGISTMKKQVELPIFGMDKGTYNIKIYAIDSFNNVSNEYIEIKNVVVKAKNYNGPW